MKTRLFVYFLVLILIVSCAACGTDVEIDSNARVNGISSNRTTTPPLLLIPKNQGTSDGVEPTPQSCFTGRGSVMVVCNQTSKVWFEKMVYASFDFNMAGISIAVEEVIYETVPLKTTELDIKFNMAHINSLAPLKPGARFVMIFSIADEYEGYTASASLQRMFYLSDDNIITPVVSSPLLKEFDGMKLDEFKESVLKYREEGLEEYPYFRQREYDYLTDTSSKMFDLEGLNAAIFDGVVDGLNGMSKQHEDSAYIPCIGVYGKYDVEGGQRYILEVLYKTFYRYDAEESYAMSIFSESLILAAITVSGSEEGGYTCSDFDYVFRKTEGKKDVRIICGKESGLAEEIIDAKANAVVITPLLYEMVTTFCALPEIDIKYTDENSIPISQHIKALQEGEQSAETSKSEERDFGTAIERYFDEHYLMDAKEGEYIKLLDWVDKTSIYYWDSQMKLEVAEGAVVLAEVEVNLEHPEHVGFGANGKHTMRIYLGKETADSEWYVDKFETKILS